MQLSIRSSLFCCRLAMVLFFACCCMRSRATHTLIPHANICCPTLLLRSCSKGNRLRYKLWAWQSSAAQHNTLHICLAPKMATNNFNGNARYTPVCEYVFMRVSARVCVCVYVCACPWLQLVIVSTLCVMRFMPTDRKLLINWTLKKRFMCLQY